MQTLIDVTKFAEMAHSTPATVRYWVHTGYAPPSAKIGRRRVWKKAEVEAWIEARFEESK